jgi:DUF1009 family protein
MSTVGLIAGSGELPFILARTLREKGYDLVIVALKNFASEDLIQFASSFKSIYIGKVGEIISFLKKNKVKELILTGKIPKNIIYKLDNIKPDLKALKILFSANFRGDNEILQLIENEINKEGIKLVDITKFCPDFLTPEGVLTNKHPNKEQWEDIKYGFKIAKKVGELDIGQTIVVKDKSVIAVESIEGTDETILRAGRYVEDAVIIKISKPQQNLKLDPPVVGVNTIINMKTAKAKVLAIEAEKSIIINRQEVIEKANEYNIIIVGVKES